MRLSKAQLDLIKKRGGAVVEPKRKQARTESVPSQSALAPAPATQSPAIDKAVEAMATNSAATMAAVEQIRAIAEAIGKSANASSPIPQPQPAYRLTVIRDKNQRMTEIVARPFVAKEK